MFLREVNIPMHTMLFLQDFSSLKDVCCSVIEDNQFLKVKGYER